MVPYPYSVILRNFQNGACVALHFVTWYVTMTPERDHVIYNQDDDGEKQLTQENFSVIQCSAKYIDFEGISYIIVDESRKLCDIRSYNLGL